MKCRADPALAPNADLKRVISLTLKDSEESFETTLEQREPRCAGELRAATAASQWFQVLRARRLNRACGFKLRFGSLVGTARAGPTSRELGGLAQRPRAGPGRQQGWQGWGRGAPKSSVPGWGAGHWKKPALNFQNQLKLEWCRDSNLNISGMHGCHPVSHNPTLIELQNSRVCATWDLATEERLHCDLQQTSSNSKPLCVLHC